ncbi:MAG: uridine diphosphate-N-acetylglucosamine-binding protein YvcK [Deltaproteobacteria bacterium]|nr:uridine diphosphate-N-acetylglucosamine-binding protein YvcK [Deltaproteobacteria bacterium]
MKRERQKLITIGGGSGQFSLLSGLRDLKEIDISAIVSMADSGGSTGRLRDELGILPPGDVLKCILALSPHRDIARKIFLKRFMKDRRLKGHNAGNMLLSMLSQYTGSFPSGIQALAEILDVRSTILPVTTDRVTLVAELTDGRRIYGQTAIDIPQGTNREKILNVFLVPHYGDSISVYPPVIEAIESAHHIIIGPGDLFTSIIPNIIVPGVKEALQRTSAALSYVVNIMTKFGETHQFKAQDFAKTVEESIQRRFDGIIYNTRKPDEKLLEQYAKQKAEFVTIDESDEWWGNRTMHGADILDVSGGILRHNSKNLASLIQSILFRDK